MQCIEHRKSEYDKVSAEYESWKAKGLKLNMARGKPSKKQLGAGQRRGRPQLRRAQGS